ncbi:hypothetical protein BDV93DRAFT_504792 [Ceratobasidium sp. AG-I]|nr:hypothetical protein BDV93DRAFT_504792 [Ceratobasidium sp. AG-I]
MAHAGADRALHMSNTNPYEETKEVQVASKVSTAGTLAFADISANGNRAIGTPANGYPQEGNYFSDNAKSKEILGLMYIAFEDMLKDQLEQFVALEKELGAHMSKISAGRWDGTVDEVESTIRCSMAANAVLSGIPSSTARGLRCILQEVHIIISFGGLCAFITRRREWSRCSSLFIIISLGRRKLSEAGSGSEYSWLRGQSALGRPVKAGSLQEVLHPRHAP